MVYDNIEWDKLNMKVNECIQKDIDEEIGTIKLIEEREGYYPGIIKLHYPQSAEDIIKEVSEEEEEDEEEEDEEDEEEDEEDEEEEDEEDEEEEDEEEEEEEDEDEEEEDEEDEEDEEELLDDSFDVSPKQISKIAWNNHNVERSRNPFWGPKITYKREEIKEDELEDENEETYSMECIHLNGDDDEIYIYPISDGQELCLCKNCNMMLASKILEQLALETFLK